MHKRLHRHLKLVHHSHTGKRLSHHYTSYAGVLLIFGSLFLAIAAVQHVAALDYTVAAKISAPPPTQPAVIDSIASNSHVSSSQLTLEGSCEQLTPPGVVTIIRASNIVGSAPCDGSGHFSVSVTLNPGENRLVPQIVNATEDLGPPGQEIIIFYDEPLAPTVGVSAHSDTTEGKKADSLPETVDSSRPLVFGTEQYFITLTEGKVASLVFTITGGSAPYILGVDTGNGFQRYVFDTEGQHFWSADLSKDGAMPNKVRFILRDAQGRQVMVELAILNLTPNIGELSSGIATPPSLSPMDLQPVWGAYTGASLLVIVTWALHHIFWTPRLAFVHPSPASAHDGRSVHRGGRRR